jgi:hypothetical protein
MLLALFKGGTSVYDQAIRLSHVRTHRRLLFMSNVITLKLLKHEPVLNTNIGVRLPIYR